MRHRGWTQTALAGRIGVSRSHLSKLLSDKRRWTLDVLQRLAKVLETTLEQLVAGTSVQDVVAASEATQKQVTDMATQLAAVAAERDALGLERDSLRGEVELLRAEVEQRPTQSEHDGERAGRTAAEQREAIVRRRVASLESQLRRQEADAARQLRALQTQLEESNRRVVHNGNVAEQFKFIAESRGARLEGLGGLVILGLGIGLIAAAASNG